MWVSPNAHRRPSGIVHAWDMFIKMLIAPRMLSEVRKWISNRASGTAELTSIIHWLRKADHGRFLQWDIPKVWKGWIHVEGSHRIFRNVLWYARKTLQNAPSWASWACMFPIGNICPEMSFQNQFATFAIKHIRSLTGTISCETPSQAAWVLSEHTSLSSVTGGAQRVHSFSCWKDRNHPLAYSRKRIFKKPCLYALLQWTSWLITTNSTEMRKALTWQGRVFAQRKHVEGCGLIHNFSTGRRSRRDWITQMSCSSWQHKYDSECSERLSTTRHAWAQ